jgi:Na+/melibiose symporter-like transporter
MDISNTLKSWIFIFIAVMCFLIAIQEHRKYKYLSKELDRIINEIKKYKVLKKREDEKCPKKKIK